MGTSKFSDFRRELDFKRGVYTRQLIWHLQNGKSVQLVFERLISMEVSNLGCQRVMLKPLNFAGTAQVIIGLRNNFV